MNGSSLHEDLHRSVEVWRPSDLSFGLAAGRDFRSLGWAYPSGLGPLNCGWTRLGLLLQRIVSPVVLEVLFFLVLTSIKLVMRLVGHQPRRLGFDRNARIYLIDRHPPASESMRQQF